MGHCYGPAADMKWRASEMFDAEQLEANGSTYNIYNRVESSDLMKMHLVDRFVVNVGLCLCQSRKDECSPLLYDVGQRRIVNNFKNVAEMAVRMLFFRSNTC